MTVEEFLDWERTQELRWEFDGRRAVAMTGGTLAHSEVATNIVELLHAHLDAGPCRAFRGDVKFLVNGRVRYPDAVVTCSPIDLGSDIVPDPVVVFEVLSPGTDRTDRIVKNEEYRATPSIRRYVMLEQDAVAATVFARTGEDWVGHLLTGAAVPAMPEIGAELALADIYAGALPEAAER